MIRLVLSFPIFGYVTAAPQSLENARQTCATFEAHVINLENDDKITSARASMKTAGKIYWTGGHYRDHHWKWNSGYDVTGPYCHTHSIPTSYQEDYVVTVKKAKDGLCLEFTSIHNLAEVMCETKEMNMRASITPHFKRKSGNNSVIIRQRPNGRPHPHFGA